MKIYCSMIVKNEKECLEKCLSSMRGLDKICIVDTGSTSEHLTKMQEICSKFPNVEFIVGEYLWQDSYCDARNLALNKIPMDNETWVFTNDADMWLEEGGVAALREA